MEERKSIFTCFVNFVAREINEEDTDQEDTHQGSNDGDQRQLRSCELSPRPVIERRGVTFIFMLNAQCSHEMIKVTFDGSYDED